MKCERKFDVVEVWDVEVCVFVEDGGVVCVYGEERVGV